jgi:hypothetical protein
MKITMQTGNMVISTNRPMPLQTSFDKSTDKRKLFGLQTAINILPICYLFKGLKDLPPPSNNLSSPLLGNMFWIEVQRPLLLIPKDH